MKINFSKKLLFIFGLFIFFIILNCKPSFAYDLETDFLLSPDYNTSWVESYLDLDMNFSDGVKALIDSHQDYFNITSSDLSRYWILLRFDYPDSTGASEKHFYVYYCGASEFTLYNMNGVNESYCYNTVYLEPGGNRYSMLFTEDGFYASSDLLDDTHGNTNGGKNLYYFGIPVDWKIVTKTITASNHDIYGQHMDNLLFQQPTLKTATTLAPVIQREKTKGTLQVVLTEIIQILPLIIVVLVSLVGLRKALKMLFTVLRRS